MKLLEKDIIIIGLALGCCLVFQSTKAAEPANELIGVYAGTPEQNDYASFTSRIRRINKTHQIIENMVWDLREPWDDTLYAEVNVYRQDGGGWHPLFKRYKKEVCSALFDKKGMAHGVKMTFAPDLPDECPLKPGIYNLTSVIIPRYRKDWNPGLKGLIPPLVPSADKWKVDCKIFTENDKLLGLFRVEFRLINEFSSQ